MKHVFVVNPKAGVKDSSKDIQDAVESLKEKIDYFVYITKSKGDDEVFVKEYLSKHPTEEVRFYACGGDGTLFGVINGMIGYNNASVTCIPIGSGNDFLKYYKDPDKFKYLVNLIDGEEVEIDLINNNGKYISNVFNVGFDSKVVVKQAKLKKWPLMSGKSAYTFGVFFSLLGRIWYKVKVFVDDELLFDGKMTLCAVANAICYGGGYYCCPIAKNDDGLLDLCLVKKVSKITFAKLVSSYKAGTHLQNEKIKKYLIYKQAHKVNIQTDKPLPYSADGEIEYSNNISLEIAPKAIKFVVPKVLIKQNN